MKLNKGQIKGLRAESHRLKLKPVVIIGQKGLSENLHAEIDAALTHHELLKLRIPGLQKTQKKEIANLICEQHQAELVELIGNVMVIFRRYIEQDRYSKILQGRT
jgi:RNA-binding protein